MPSLTTFSVEKKRLLMVLLQFRYLARRQVRCVDSAMYALRDRRPKRMRWQRPARNGVIVAGIGLEGITSQQYGQELVVGNRLYLGTDYSSGHLVDFLSLSGQAGIICDDLLGEPCCAHGQKAYAVKSNQCFHWPAHPRQEKNQILGNENSATSGCYKVGIPQEMF